MIASAEREGWSLEPRAGAADKIRASRTQNIAKTLPYPKRRNNASGSKKIERKLAVTLAGVKTQNGLHGLRENAQQREVVPRSPLNLSASDDIFFHHTQGGQDEI
jgi:hypothetical protein